MRYYESGDWGFSLVWGIQASVFPRSLAMAALNAVLTFFFATWLSSKERSPHLINKGYDTLDNTMTLLGLYTSVMTFVLYFRSNIAYSRWWEGGTLLQKTRGEWFNAYSSLMAFTSTDPKMADKVEEFQHLLARLMSLLFCCGLQQVSPSKDRAFEVIELDGIDRTSLEFLNNAVDKVEVILQWIQRATVIHMQSGVVPVAPPVLSRAFQEVSRGIVNLQNARKIADFPFPFPYAQASMVMLLLHWVYTPVACSYYFSDYYWHRAIATAVSFMVIFFLWCINFIALQLEAPFGSKQNDLPMNQMQQDWNKSLTVLLDKRAHRPPDFQFNGDEHRQLNMMMSDGTQPKKKHRFVDLLASEPISVSKTKSRRSTFVAGGTGTFSLCELRAERKKSPHGSQGTQKWDQSVNNSADDSRPVGSGTAVSRVSQASVASAVASDIVQTNSVKSQAALSLGTEVPRELPISPLTTSFIDLHLRSDGSPAGSGIGLNIDVPEASFSSLQARTNSGLSPGSRHLGKAMRNAGFQEKLVENVAGHTDTSHEAWERQLADVGMRMKELHSCLIDEEVRLLASVTRRTASPTVTEEEAAIVPLSCCYPKMVSIRPHASVIS